MKNKDLKKGKESIIGKIIYGFLLFMPLIAILSTILINSFNMSAKQESQIIYKYETNEVNSSSDLLEGNIYSFNYANLDYQSITEYDSLSTIKPLTSFRVKTPQGDEVYFEEDISILPYVSISFSNEYIYINYDENGNNYSSLTYYIILDNFVGILIEDNGLIYSHISSTDYNEIESVETHNLDTQEVFYNAVDKVEQSSLFNWAENSLIYTGIADTCTQLSITSTFIPLLLAYWLIISVIYILYDIILMILIILHNKIHQIQDSI